MRFLLLGLTLCPAADAIEVTPIDPPQQRALHARDLQGRQVDLQRLTGKVVIVSFWTTWCPPCVRELPSLQALAETYPNEIAVLAVNAGESGYRVRHFRGLPKAPVKVLLDVDAELVASWSVELYPTALVIDRQGRVVYRLRGEVDWYSPEINDLLQTLIK